LHRLGDDLCSSWCPRITDLLVQFYGFYGYSVSTLGIVVGAFWGFLEGFVHFGIFAWLYNLLLGRLQAELDS
jgi:hypothetical protein